MKYEQYLLYILAGGSIKGRFFLDFLMDLTGKIEESKDCRSEVKDMAKKIGEQALFIRSKGHDDRLGDGAGEWIVLDKLLGEYIDLFWR